MSMRLGTHNDWHSNPNPDPGRRLGELGFGMSPQGGQMAVLAAATRLLHFIEHFKTVTELRGRGRVAWCRMRLGMRAPSVHLHAIHVLTVATGLS